MFNKSKYVLKKDIEFLNDLLDEAIHDLNLVKAKYSTERKISEMYKALINRCIKDLEQAANEIVFYKKELSALTKIADSRLETAMDNFDASLKKKAAPKKVK